MEAIIPEADVTPCWEGVKKCARCGHRASIASVSPWISLEAVCPHTAFFRNCEIFHTFWGQGNWISLKILDELQIGRLSKALERVFQGDFDRDIYSYDREQVYPLKKLGHAQDEQRMVAQRRDLSGWLLIASGGGT